MNAVELIGKLILLSDEDKQQEVFFWGADDLPCVVDDINFRDYSDDEHFDNLKGLELL